MASTARRMRASQRARLSERQYAERFREEAAQLKQQIKALRERNGELKGLSEEQRDLINSLQDENRDLHQQLHDEEPTSDEDEGLHGVTKSGNGDHKQIIKGSALPADPKK